MQKASYGDMRHVVARIAYTRLYRTIRANQPMTNYDRRVFPDIIRKAQISLENKKPKKISISVTSRVLSSYKWHIVFETEDRLREKEKCNGWSNYETWIVHCWLTDESKSYNMLRILFNCCETVEELEDSVKDYVENQNPLARKASMFVDLMEYGIGGEFVQKQVILFFLEF